MRLPFSRGRLIARSGPPPPLRVRVRRRLSRPPKLSGDHSRDLMPDDFTRPPLVCIPPQLVQLGAMLEGMSPERRLVLAESVSPNGWPWWMAKWEEWIGWRAFLEMCEQAFSAIDEGIPAANALYVIVDEAGGFA
jgi:hypothetical protein